MNLIFMRHGEATDNVKEVFSDKEIYWSTLTQGGKDTASESIAGLPRNIDKIYVSPLPRTIQTANLVYEKYSSAEVLIDNRLREINHGKYSGKKNNEELDLVREKQVAGDYFIRFGQYGENKFDIESRLIAFLQDLKNDNLNSNTVMIVSHGSITSFLKRLLNIKSPHIKTGKAEIFNNVDLKMLGESIKTLKNVKLQKINDRINLINKLSLSNKLKDNLIKLVKNGFNNIESSDEVLNGYLDGLTSNSLTKKNDVKFDDGIIAILFYNSFENLAAKWMDHYITLGIHNFVMVNNNSTDNSEKIIRSYSDRVNIAIYEISEKYNCNKMCGWRQQIMEYFGVGRTYLTIDSDELLVYKNYENISLNELIGASSKKYYKAIMIDVYSDKKLGTGSIQDYKFVDKNTYKIAKSQYYGHAYYGGPRERIFGIRPSLQKVPIIKYTGCEIFINDHFYYPWDINKKAELNFYLLHYKFLPGDAKKYMEYAKDGRHWNNSIEYKVYVDLLENEKEVNFFDENISTTITNFLNCSKDLL